MDLLSGEAIGRWSGDAKWRLKKSLNECQLDGSSYHPFVMPNSSCCIISSSYFLFQDSGDDKKLPHDLQYSISQLR